MHPRLVCIVSNAGDKLWLGRYLQLSDKDKLVQPPVSLPCVLNKSYDSVIARTMDQSITLMILLEFKNRNRKAFCTVAAQQHGYFCSVSFVLGSAHALIVPQEQPELKKVRVSLLYDGRCLWLSCSCAIGSTSRSSLFSGIMSAGNLHLNGAGD
jgi:hypothetical protein